MDSMNVCICLLILLAGYCIELDRISINNWNPPLIMNSFLHSFYCSYYSNDIVSGLSSGSSNWSDPPLPNEYSTIFKQYNKWNGSSMGKLFFQLGLLIFIIWLLTYLLAGNTFINLQHSYAMSVSSLSRWNIRVKNDVWLANMALGSDYSSTSIVYTSSRLFKSFL